MSDLIGKQLGGFQIIELIGQGGMAAVYKAYQATMDRYVAIKVLPGQLAKDPQFVGRFKQEARVIAALEHAHILPVYDFGEDQGHLYIVMRLVETGTLADLVHDGKPLPLRQVLKIISQIGDALDHAHSHNIIHRDIKPTNVLMTQRGHCLLTDFGIAKLSGGTSQFTQTGGIVGTPIYMSPEQGLGNPLDGRSDIYALGVILYHLAVGQVPYTADTPMALVMKHIQASPPRPSQINPDVPPAVEAVILKAMEKKPDDRYSTAGEMVNALEEAILNQGKTITPPVKPVETVSPPVDNIPETVVQPPSTPPPPSKPQKSGVGRTLAVGGLGMFGGIGVAILGLIGLCVFCMVVANMSGGSTSSPTQVPEINTNTPASPPTEPIVDPPTDIPTEMPTTVSRDITGDYNVFGTNQDGSSYQGTATITHVSGSDYTITWLIGETILEGPGVLEGDIFTANDGTIVGVYTIKPDGVLDGVWIQEGVDGEGTEQLIPR